MNQYRIKEIDGKFYPQEKFFFFFWDNVKLHNRVSRDWFINSVQDNLYNGMVEYYACKDGWGVTFWISPMFNTLESAKLFIEEYKNFLERKYQRQKAKYYY